MLDVVGVEPYVPLEPSIQAALDGLRVALQRRFAPANVACFVRDLDEEPAWGHAEVLQGSYLPHCEYVV